jgi:4-hydroxybenzoate polyprenyltransferase
LLNNERNWLELIVLLWCNFCGIVLIYTINGYVDQLSFKFNLREFFEERWHVIFVIQLFLFTFPVAFLTISSFRFIAFALMASLGIIYSAGFRQNEYRFRVKNIFLFKNLSIGIAWGTLVLIGAGDFRDPDVISLFIFASIQVFIGSMIRDVPDLQKDKEQGVKTFPVLFGLNATFWFMHLVNFSSVLSAFFTGWSQGTLLIIITGISWRFINLWKLKGNAESKVWGQTINLATCAVILFLVIIQYLGNYFGTH